MTLHCKDNVINFPNVSKSQFFKKFMVNTNRHVKFGVHVTFGLGVRYGWYFSSLPQVKRVGPMPSLKLGL